MSIMARARARDPSHGYAIDFVTEVLAPHLAEIGRRGVRILANAGVVLLVTAPLIPLFMSNAAGRAPRGQ